MPLYEYECGRCGRRFELIQKFSDPPTAACTCGGAANRLLSASSFQFKGSGFYATDYAKKSAPADSPASADKSDGKPAEGDRNVAPHSGKKPETKTESKQDSKPAGKPAK